MLAIMHGKNKKQVKKIAIYTLLFLGSISLVSTPKSYSAFYDKNDETLVYKAQLYNLYNESNLILDTALEDTARLKMTFKTNKAVTSGEIDTYEISIPSTCKFNSIDTNATKNKISDTKYTIKYEGDINRDYLNTLYFTCSVDISEPKVEITAKISETIGDTATNQPFIYAKATYSELIDNYISHIPPNVDDSEVVPEASAYEAFVKWYEAYGKRAGYSSEVNEYVKSVFKSETEFNDKSNYTALPGLKINYDKANVGNEYTFTILDNFIGYARTYYRYNNGLANPEAGSATLYFSTDNKNSLNTAIGEYLKKYVFPSDSEAVTLVDKYIKDKGGIYSVIFENNEFTGIECFEYNDETKGAAIRIYNDTILTIAKAASAKKVQIAFANYVKMVMDLRDGLIAAYSGTLSSDVIKKIINKNDIIESITTNCTSDIESHPVTTSKISFIDSFMYQFDDKTIIIKISTDLDNNPGYTTAEIIELEAPTDMEIIFTNTNDSEFTVNINGSNKTDVDKMVDDLDKYFNVTTNDSDITVKVNTSTEYSIEYKVTKGTNVRTVSTITENVSTSSTKSNSTSNIQTKAPVVSDNNQPINDVTADNSASTDNKTSASTNKDNNGTTDTSTEEDKGSTSDDNSDDKGSTSDDNSDDSGTVSDKIVAKKEDNNTDLNANNDNSNNDSN